MILRQDGDVNEAREQETPTPEEIEADFNSTLEAIDHLCEHIKKGCLSGIPARASTCRNERLHKHLIMKRSLLGGAHTISPELAFAVLSVLLLAWTSRRGSDPQKHQFNKRLNPLCPVELHRPDSCPVLAQSQASSHSAELPMNWKGTYSGSSTSIAFDKSE